MSETHVFEAAAACWRDGIPAAMATVVRVSGSAPRAGGARLLLREDGVQFGTIGGGEVERRVLLIAEEVLRSGAPALWRAHLTRDLGMCCGGEMEVFVEPVEARIPIVIFGAGHVGFATAEALHRLDFAVTVVDARPEWLTAERFPQATRILAEPLAFVATWNPTARAGALIATHAHDLDQALVEALLPRDLAWLGMLGSRAKVGRFLMRLGAAGVDPALFPRLSAPVGLDIGAETPAEIALSIAGELVALRRGRRDAGSLADRPLSARGGDGRAHPKGWIRTAPPSRSGDESP